jgi:hypothetical protein
MGKQATVHSMVFKEELKEILAQEKAANADKQKRGPKPKQRQKSSVIA